MVTKQFNAAEYIDNFRLDNPVSYSVEDSGSAFIFFCREIGYSRKSVKTAERCVKYTHKKYPSVGWLNKAVAENGIVAVGKQMTPTSAHGSAYLHFLMIAGLVKLRFYDYFTVNPTSLRKLDSWLDSSKEKMGIAEFAGAVEAVAADTENRNINLEKVRAKSSRAGLYLVLRHNLASIRDISV